MGQMKISKNRRAISQSMDLFIIIAAVLAAGGVVVTAISSLIGAAASQSNVTLTGISIASAGNSLSFTLKNTGTSALTVGSSDTVTISGISVTVAASATCSAPASFAGQTAVTWTEATNLGSCTASGTTAGTVTSLKFSGPSSSPPSLLPGQVLSFTADPVLSSSVFTSGSSYTVSITGPSISFSENVVSQ